MLYKINVEILLLHFKGTKIMNTEFVFKVKKEMYRIKKKKEMYRIIQNVSSVSFEYFIWHLTSQIGLNASLFWFQGFLCLSFSVMIFREM